MDKADVELLMRLQYDFTLSPTPFDELADSLGTDVLDVIRRLRRYLAEGVVLRLGLQLNYRSLDENKAALVALRVHERAIAEVAREVNHTMGVKHNYIRDCEEFNLWFTIKAKTLHEVHRRVASIKDLPGVEDWVILPTKRVYKLDIKYDLLRGVSWSEPVIQPEEVPNIRESGFDSRLLIDLERRFELVRRPFKSMAERHGLPDEERLLALIEELIRLGVARGFGATLSSEKIGFVDNAMVVLKVNPGEASAVCERIVRGFPQVTHCVERIASPKWDYPAYVMLHARGRDKIIEIVDALRRVPGVLEARPIFSIMNLGGLR